jgi:hypothetical protein
VTVKHSRTLPLDASEAALRAEEGHVRAYLSAATTPDDDPIARADEVVVSLQPKDGQWWMTGELPGEPVADYLADDYDPYDGVPDELRAVGEVNG